MECAGEVCKEAREPAKKAESEHHASTSEGGSALKVGLCLSNNLRILTRWYVCLFEGGWAGERVRKRERKNVGEKHNQPVWIWERERETSKWEKNMVRSPPGAGIEPATFWCMGQHSNQMSHPARIKQFFNYHPWDCLQKLPVTSSNV